MTDVQQVKPGGVRFGATVGGRLWYCEIRKQHQPKMALGGRCYRCGKQVL